MRIDRKAALAAGIGLAACTWLAGSGTAVARTDFLTLAEGKYPQIAGTRIDACGLCHRKSIPGLNPYGRAWRGAGSDSAAFDAIRRRDSDRDGFRNIREINAGTFPGRRRSHP